MMARILARAGWRVSARSVARYRKERILPPPVTEPPKRRTTPVFSRFVHHTWMMDVTVMRQLLGPDLHVAAVFDAFSRVPLTITVFDRRPKALDMARLLMLARRAFTIPKYVITVLGGEFTGKRFARAVARLGAVQRFASADTLYATARLERFWRTLKQSARLRFLGLPLTVEDLERRLEEALAYYIVFRPHEGLGGAVPAEALLGLERSPDAAVEPPRGRPGERSAVVPPFTIAHFGDSRVFPILTVAA
jgi:transposase InsO family protein